MEGGRTVTCAMGHPQRGIRTVQTGAGEAGSASQRKGPGKVQTLCSGKHSCRVVVGKRPYQRSDHNADKS